MHVHYLFDDTLPVAAIKGKLEAFRYARQTTVEISVAHIRCYPVTFVCSAVLFVIFPGEREKRNNVVKMTDRHRRWLCRAMQQGPSTKDVRKEGEGLADTDLK